MKEEIFTGGKRQEGIMVLWQDQQQMKSRFFEYGELIDQKINALDLLDHPKMYRLDPESKKKNDGQLNGSGNRQTLSLFLPVSSIFPGTELPGFVRRSPYRHPILHFNTGTGAILLEYGK